MIQNFIKKMKSKKGFTLIELIVVIAILGILAMIAIPRFNGIQDRAREQTDIANARSLASVGAAMIASGQLPVNANYQALGDNPNFANNLSNGWPVVRATASSPANTPLVLRVDAAGVVTVTVNNNAGAATQLYPNPAGDWAN